MRRYFLNEANKNAWQIKQKITANHSTRVVYIITKLGGAELGEYDDFWDAVLDAEDKYCTEANMIDAYYVIADEDGMNSYQPVEEGKPFDGRWTEEEEGTIVEPSQSYEDYLKNESLNEASAFPTADSFTTSWITRTPAKNTTQQNNSQNNQTSSTQSNTAPKAVPLSPQEERDLNRASNSGNRIEYALAMLGIYMVRKAPQYGLDINDAKVAAFYGKGLDDLCADVETDEVWPTIQEAEAQFIQVLGRAMTGDERQFMKEALAVLNDIAPDSYPAVFRNASDFYEFRAYHWFDSECGYDDYEYAFEMGMAGNPEDDWTEMMGGYNHAGEYLECAYAFGQDSGKFFKLCGI